MTRHSRRLYARILWIVCLLLLQTNVFAKQAEYIDQEQTSATSVDDIQTPLEHAFEKDKPAAQRLPLLKNKLNGQAPFLRDTQLTLRPRTYYFNQKNSGKPDNEALAFGGSLDYLSGQWEDHIQVGLTLYTSQKLYGPKEKDGTRLLKPGQKSFSTAGEAYVKIRAYDENYLTLYRQELNVPYINREDNRMIPNTFEAYTLGNKDNPKFKYIISYIDKMKTRDSSKFVSMTEAAGFSGTDKGLTMAGGSYTFQKGSDIGITSQHAWDFMRTTYAEANTQWHITDGWDARLSAQYTKQQSIGDEIGGDFDTNVWGTAFSISHAGILVTFATSKTDSNSGIRSPFGGYPGYLSLMQQDFNRADESGFLIGVTSDLRYFDIKGLSASVNMAWGDTPESGKAASPDQKEIDFTLDYRLPSGKFNGLWLRARAAHTDQDDHPTEVDRTDIRFTVNYEIPIL